MSTWIIGLLAFVTYLSSCSGQGVTFQCNKDATHMTMTLTEEKNTNTAYKIFDTVTDSVTTCVGTTFQINSVDYLKLEVATLLSDGSPDNGACTVSVADTVVTYKVVRFSGDFIKSSDKLYTFSCDSASANGEVKTSDEITVTTIATNFLSPETLSTASQGDVVFSLQTAAGATAPTTVVFGTDYQFHVALTRTGQAGVPLFLQCTGLWASETSDFSTQVEVLTSEGCLPTTPVLNPIALASVFAVTPTPTLTSTSVEAKTGLFAMPILASGSKTIYFRFMYKLNCYFTDEAKCFNPTQHCTARRRRSTEEQVQNGTLEFGVQVSFGGSGSTSGLGGDKGSTDTMSEKECEVVTSFWVVSIVLGILLLIVLVFAVMLFFKLKLERRSKLVDDRSGISNPNF